MNRRLGMTIALVAGLTAAAVGATAAMADTAAVSDPTGDALGIDSSYAAYGDWDIDLVSVAIDHHDDQLSITGTFVNTVSDSWNDLEVQLDTNADSVADLALVWSKQYRYAKAFRMDSTGSLGEVLCDIATAETIGQGGSVNVSVARSCIGSPASVGVHLDVIWASASTSDPLYFVDSAPGTLADKPTTFSAPVNVSTTVIVPSGTAPEVTTVPPVVIPPVAPAPAPVAASPITAPLVSHVSLDASAKKQKYKKQSTRIVARVTAATTPQGIVRFYDGKKAIAKATVHGGKAVLKLSKKTRVGLHKITAKFVPANATVFAPSASKAVLVRVTR